MVKFNATIKQFDKQGEKTGWTYIDVPAAIAHQLKPGNKIGFRVKGKLDSFAITGIALLPMGGGDFILTLNADLRKGIKKRKGDTLSVQIEEDKKGYELNKEFIECLNDEPVALAFFDTLNQGHRNYFSKWVDSAKSVETRSKRIAQAINALSKKWGYPEMIRAQVADNKKLKGL